MHTAKTYNVKLPHATIKNKNVELILHYLRHFKDVPGKILDVGCLTGNFLVFDKSRIYGIDIDAYAIKQAREIGLHAQQMDVCAKLEFADNYFDAINCRAVLEHIKDPQKAMAEMYRVLKPNGKLIAVTPDILKWKFNFWKCAYHLYGYPFSKNALYALAYDTGFKKIEVKHDYRAFIPIANKLRSLRVDFDTLLKIQKFFYKFKKSNNLLLIAYK